jgi:isopentenyl-diphosphate Delta-isomerase
MTIPDDLLSQASTISLRKAEHISVIASRDVESVSRPGWDDVRLIHSALPEIDLREVDTSTELLGKRLAVPLVIASMTGGHPAALTVNRVLARAADAYGVAMGVGSQRAALRDRTLQYTYAVVRQEAPDAFVIANIGAPQLIQQDGAPPLSTSDIEAIVSMVGADALAVHLNYLEEAVMTEGDRRARGCRDAIARLAQELAVPLIGKETGAGLSTEAALALRAAGVKALDVGGLGGTSFAAVEGARAKASGDETGAMLGEAFRDWGIPTAVSLVQSRGTGLPIVATGGVRSGLDAARAIALGATAVGVARPLLLAALDGFDAVAAWIEQFVAALRTAMFLTGATAVGDLRGRQTVILGETAAWLQQLGDGS